MRRRSSSNQERRGALNGAKSGTKIQGKRRRRRARALQARRVKQVTRDAQLVETVFGTRDIDFRFSWEKNAVRKWWSFRESYVIGLPSGGHIAVKKLVNSGSHSYKALKGEIRTLSKIRHKSIVKILGFCCTEDSIFLIYEYLTKGSLGVFRCNGIWIEDSCWGCARIGLSSQ